MIRTIKTTNHRSIFIIIWAAATAHIIQAIILLLTDEANETIDVAIIFEFLPKDDAPIFMILSSGFAIIAVVSEIITPLMRFLLLTPQQFLLVLATWEAFYAVWNNSYADGTVKPGIYIFTDQIWLIVYCLIHLYSTVRCIAR